MPGVDQVPHIRTSERVLFKRCQRAWWWAYREGLKPKRVADPLWFGQIVHIALATWYQPGLKRGPHPAETFKSLIDDGLRKLKVEEATDEEVAKYIDLSDLGVIMLENYVQRYGTDDHCFMIAPEQTFSFDIPFPDWWGDETRKLLAQYDGTWDGVYRDLATGWFWLWEHKTAKVIRLDHLPLDEQGGSYWAIARRALTKQGLMKPTDVFKGITYNFLRKGIPDERPVDAQGYATNKPEKRHYAAPLGYAGDEPEFKKMKLEDLERLAAGYGITVLGERSKIQPAKLFHREAVPRTRAEQRSQLLRIQTDASQMEMARRGELPITKTPHHSCRYCDFYHMCRLEENSGNWQDLRKVAYNVLDPYADHRKSTEEIASFEL